MDGHIRERQLETERNTLSPFAMLCCNTAGRAQPEPECPVRTAYQRDRDRIIHSSAFRRLKDKTQVFLSPEGDHYRTRLTHTLEVAQIARTIARALKLNEDLIVFRTSKALSINQAMTLICGYSEAMTLWHSKNSDYRTMQRRVMQKSRLL